MILQKPIRGRQLSQIHPLARGMIGCYLFNEYQGENVFCSRQLSNASLQLVNGGNTQEWRPGGFYMQNLGNDGAWFSVPAAPYAGIGTGNYSLIFGGDVEDNTFSTMFCFDDYDPAWYFNTGELTVYDDDNNIIGDTDARDTSGNFAIVREGTGADETKAYIDGVLDGTGQHQNSIDDPSTVRIGWDAYDDEFFEGLIKYVYFYNRALSATEVKSLHDRPFQMFDRPKLWRFAYVDAGIVDYDVSVNEQSSVIESLGNAMGDLGVFASDCASPEDMLK